MTTDARNNRELAMMHAIDLYRDGWADTVKTGGSDTANMMLVDTATAVHQFLTAESSDVAELRRRVDQWEENMGVLEDRIERLRVSVDEATNRVRDQLQALRDELALRDQAAADALDPIITRLGEIGADPANPVPDEGDIPLPPES